MSSPSSRWRNCELTPPTGLRTSSTCRWTFASQEKSTTRSNVAGESAATAIAATATAHQQTGPPKGQKSSIRADQNLAHTPPLILPQNPSLDQKQTLRPLRPTEFLRTKPRRSLLRMPTCRNLWTTLGRTLPSLMNPQMLRVPDYMWILWSIRNNPTLATQRKGATEDRFIGGALKPNAPTTTDSSPTETQNLFKILH